jgi:hypothetical protein
MKKKLIISVKPLAMLYPRAVKQAKSNKSQEVPEINSGEFYGRFVTRQRRICPGCRELSIESCFGL